MVGEQCEASCVGTLGDQSHQLLRYQKENRNPKKDFKDAQVLKENFDYNNGGSYLTIFPLVLAVSTRTYSVTCNTKLFPKYHNFHIHVYYGTGLSWHISLTHSNVTPQKKTETTNLESFEHFLKARRKLDESSSLFETSKQKMSLLLAPIRNLKKSHWHIHFSSLPHLPPDPFSSASRPQGGKGKDMRQHIST